MVQISEPFDDFRKSQNEANFSGPVQLKIVSHSYAHTTNPWAEDSLLKPRTGTKMSDTEMFICRDATRKLVVSVYWEDAQLFVVAKKPSDDGQLAEHAAWKFTPDDAHEILNDLSTGVCQIRSLNFERLVASAIGGRIAEGLLRHRWRPSNRIDPYLWN